METIGIMYQLPEDYMHPCRLQWDQCDTQLEEAPPHHHGEGEHILCLMLQYIYAQICTCRSTKGMR